MEPTFRGWIQGPAGEKQQGQGRPGRGRRVWMQTRLMPRRGTRCRPPTCQGPGHPPRDHQQQAKQQILRTLRAHRAPQGPGPGSGWVLRRDHNRGGARAPTLPPVPISSGMKAASRTTSLQHPLLRGDHRRGACAPAAPAATPTRRRATVTSCSGSSVLVAGLHGTGRRRVGWPRLLGSRPITSSTVTIPTSRSFRSTTGTAGSR